MVFAIKYQYFNIDRNVLNGCRELEKNVRPNLKVSDQISLWSDIFSGISRIC